MWGKRKEPSGKEEFLLFKKLCYAAGLVWMGFFFAASGGEAAEGIVLALSGGGTKGYAHIGVFQVLERENIPIRAVVGTSMGAIMGGLYAAGYSADDLVRIMKEQIDLPALMGDQSTSLPRGRKDRTGEVIYALHFDEKGHPVGPLGLISGRQLYNTLARYASRVNTTDFDALPIPYAAVATDLVTGEPVILREGSLADAMRASMSLPGIFEPWKFQGRLLVDGGLVANIPVRIAKELYPGYPVVAVMASSGLKERREIRSPVDVLGQMTTILTQQNMEQDLREADLIIRPEVGDLALLGTGNEDQVVYAGALAAEQALGKLALLAQATKNLEKPKTPKSTESPLVAQVLLEGFPRITEKFLAQELSRWKGKPLDTRDILDACDLIEARDDLGVVGYRLEPNPDGTVNVVVESLPLAPYELLFAGYTSNLNEHRWVGLTGLRRDLLAEGDILEVELLAGKDWSLEGRYFAPAFAYERNEYMLQARKWHVNPQNATPMEWERYALGVYASKWYGSMQVRYGLVGEKLSGAGEDVESFWWGPYLSLQYDRVDDPYDPSQGIQASARVWWANAEQILWDLRGSWYTPFQGGIRGSLQAGATGGDPDVAPHAAYLGGDTTLLHLSSSPYMGANLLWARFGLQKPLLKGGVFPVYGELFFTQGYLFDSSWSKEEQSWETGVAAFVPGRFLGGRVFVVYDDQGDITFGFEVGGPFQGFSHIPE
jgi:NTE family protein